MSERLKEHAWNACKVNSLRGFESLSVRHYFKKHTENPRKLQQENHDFNNILKYFHINLRQ